MNFRFETRRQVHKETDSMLDIRCCDNMELMREFPDKHFDLAIVDPPYFNGPEKKKFYGKEISAHGVKRISYKNIEASWHVPGPQYFNELLRVSKHQIVWGCNYYKFLFDGTGRIIWDKVNDGGTYSSILQ